MPTVIQPAFGKGELGPALFGRVDTAAYQVGLRTARNMYVHTHGGISNRPGLEFVCPVRDHTARPVLLDFQFKTTDTYIVIAEATTFRFVRAGAAVLEDTKTITGITKANPAVVTTSAAHGYTSNDDVFIASVAGMTEVNGRFFRITVLTTTTFSLQDQYDGGSTGIDSSAFTTYTSGGTVGKVFTLTTPYAQADLEELVYTQSADVMTITHSTYGVRELNRTAVNVFTLTKPTFAPSIADPTGVTVSVNGADNNVLWKYKVTAIKKETLEQSLAGVTAGLTVVSTDNTNPVSVEITGHGLITGDEVEITGLTEMTEINDRRFQITKTDADNFTLDGENGLAYTDESTGGANTCFATFDLSGTVASPTGTTIPDNTIAWNAVTGAIKYNVYRAKGDAGTFGFLAETQELSFTDDSTALQETDLALKPPTERNPFRVAGEYPAAVGYFQQRRLFGGSTNLPDTTDYSQTGNQNNFTFSDPIRADDAFRATLNSHKVNQVRHYVPQTDLLILTDGAEWDINSGDNQGFAADTINQDPQTEWGASFSRPYVLGRNILYVQENKIAVRSIGYQLNVDGYAGTDLTLLAPHIFESATLESWCYAVVPDPILYMTLSDGTAATLTFDAEQEVIAWARWDTLGDFEWTSANRAVSTDVIDSPFFIVKRIINGNTVRLVEKLSSRRYLEVEDQRFLDSSLTLDAPLAITASTAANPVVVTSASHGLSDGDLVDFEGMQFTPAFDSEFNETNPDQINNRRYFVADKTANTVTLYSNDDGLSVTNITQANPGAVTTASVHGLTTGDKIAMNNIIGMTEANNNIYTVTVTSTTAFTIGVNTTGFTAYTNGGLMYASLDGSAFAAYVDSGNMRKAVTTLAGLNHLEGETVQVLADGNVIADQTVTAGVLTLTRAASRVHVGKRYISDLETLNIEAPDATIQGKPIKISDVTVRFDRSRGLLVGPDTTRLQEMKQREDEDLGSPTELLTGDKNIVLKPDWNTNGRLFLRQVNPLPMTILAIIPHINVGRTGAERDDD